MGNSFYQGSVVQIFSPLVENPMNFTAYLAEFFGTFLLLISILATGNALIVGLTLAL